MASGRRPALGEVARDGNPNGLRPQLDDPARLKSTTRPGPRSAFRRNPLSRPGASDHRPPCRAPAMRAVEAIMRSCESAPNFDPQPYRCKHLKDKRIDVIMRGQNWTPVKFSENCKFRCCFNWLWLSWGGVKVRRRFTPGIAASAKCPAAARTTPIAFALGRPRPVHLALSSLSSHS